MSLAGHTTSTQQRRTPVAGDLVVCPRLGSVDLDRCRECPYLVSLETSATGAMFVVCAVDVPEAEIPFAW